MSLFNELKRRNVFRVAAAYAVVSWLLLQLSDILLGNFGAPEWVFKSLVVVILVGFLLALFLAWAYELTPEGVKRADEVTPDLVRPEAGRRTDRLIVIGLLLVVAVLVTERFWFKDDAQAPVTAATDAPLIVDKSIAVLPFANMSADPEQEFFADGITEDILTRLAAVGELRVISRTSIMRYKGSDKSLPEIAAELGVSHILEGSVRRVGNQVRITGQLIRAADDAHLWAESFDRELADILAVQTEIAGHIVQALQLQLTEGERERLQRQGTDNVAAYEQYLLGRAQLNQVAWAFAADAERLAHLDKTEALFRAALDLDPRYADAWAGLSQTLLSKVNSVREPDQADANYQAAMDAARRAIRLAPESAVGYVRLGRAYLYSGLGEAAAEQFQLAAEVEPDSVDVLTAQARIYGNEGRLADAVRLLERAVRIEPGNANLQSSLGWAAVSLGELRRAREAHQGAWGGTTPHCILALVSIQAGEIETARRQLARARELEPDSQFIAACALWSFLQIRDLEAAREVFESQREYFEQSSPLMTGIVLARTQPDAELEPLLVRAERIFRDEVPRPWGSTLEYMLAQIELLRGDHAAALARLETAVGLGWRAYRGLDDIIWDPIREDPRFQALVRLVDEDLARQRAELAGRARQP